MGKNQFYVKGGSSQDGKSSSHQSKPGLIQFLGDLFLKRSSGRQRSSNLPKTLVELVGRYKYLSLGHWVKRRNTHGVLDRLFDLFNGEDFKKIGNWSGGFSSLKFRTAKNGVAIDLKDGSVNDRSSLGFYRDDYGDNDHLVIGFICVDPNQFREGSDIIKIEVYEYARFDVSPVRVFEYPRKRFAKMEHTNSIITTGKLTQSEFIEVVTPILDFLEDRAIHVIRNKKNIK